MNIIIERDALLFALQRVIGAVDRKTTIAVLQHVAIAATSDAIRLTATNLDMQATTVCAAESDGEHRFTLPGATTLDILNHLSPGVQVVLSRDASDPRIILKSGRTRFKLPTLRPDDMPIMSAPEGEALRLPASALASILDASMYAVSKNTAQLIMTGIVTGIYIQPKDGALHATGTDSLRVGSGWAAAFGDTGTAIIPFGLATEMARMAAAEGGAELVIGKRLAQLTANGSVLIGKIIEGGYVGYEAVVALDRPYSLTVGRDLLIAAIRRALVMAPDKNRSMLLNISADTLSITSRNADTGEAENEIEVEWEGPDRAVNLNGSILMDALTHLSGESVTLQFPEKPAPIMIEENDRLALVGVQRG